MNTYDLEDQIERMVEIRMNALDRRYMSSDMSEVEYDREVAAIDFWAGTQYARVKHGLPLAFDLEVVMTSI